MRYTGIVLSPKTCCCIEGLLFSGVPIDVHIGLSLPLASSDASPIVRKELIITLSKLINRFEDQFIEVLFYLNCSILLSWQNTDDALYGNPIRSLKRSCNKTLCRGKKTKERRWQRRTERKMEFLFQSQLQQVSIRTDCMI